MAPGEEAAERCMMFRRLQWFLLPQLTVWVAGYIFKIREEFRTSAQLTFAVLSGARSAYLLVTPSAMANEYFVPLTPGSMVFITKLSMEGFGNLPEYAMLPHCAVHPFMPHQALIHSPIGTWHGRHTLAINHLGIRIHTPPWTRMVSSCIGCTRTALQRS
jgi:hypothetical protein